MSMPLNVHSVSDPHPHEIGFLQMLSKHSCGVGRTTPSSAVVAENIAKLSVRGFGAYEYKWNGHKHKRPRCGYLAATNILSLNSIATF